FNYNTSILFKQYIHFVNFHAIHNSVFSFLEKQWEPKNQILSKISHDLTAEILSRLPVKSLLRFRCVSKSWLFLISSPEFETNYLEVSTTRRRRLVFGTATALYTCPLNGIFYELPHVDYEQCDFTKDYRDDKIQMVGSCNGLVCLVYLFTGHIFVWNPAIRKCRQLPSPQASYREPCGFGYDASSDDYKVLQIVHKLNSTPYSRTYSLRNDSWKSSDWTHGRISITRV
ncbi:F-box/kelch-repeat protein At3g23880-like, partial [Primulina eburnea]|uniref:F-box/kelch-repeat protein At3g23880-like n=1 Tax=Primulina eburnea TaxID=1245227 RepID=UPI003C6BE73E